MSRTITIVVLALAVVTSVGAADSTGESPLARLGRGEIDAVEHQYAEVQRGFVSGQLAEHEVLDAYKAFYQATDTYSDALNAWIAKYPKSASAHVASGVYYRKLGELRRGTDYYRSVPEDARQYLEAMYSVAKPHLEEALRLDPKSYISVLHLLNIAQFEGNSAAARMYLDRANGILPSNFLARARYMVHLAPKWGGSFDAMEKFLGECESQNFDPKKVRWLKALVAEERGLVAENGNNWAEAEPNYVEALEDAIDADERFHSDYLDFAIQLCSIPSHAPAPYCQWRSRISH